MTLHELEFLPAEKTVSVPTGTVLAEAARLAGVEIQQPCGGQGRCGRCVVQCLKGSVRARSTLRLAPEAVAEGFRLACQAVIEQNALIEIPPQEKIERQLTTDRTAAEVRVPPGYDPDRLQAIRRVALSISPPNLEDQTDDWARLQRALCEAVNVDQVEISLDLLQHLSQVLREGQWQLTATLDTAVGESPVRARLIDLQPGLVEPQAPLWAAAIDIGTTTVSLWLVDLMNGEVRAQVAEYNQQLRRGEDVISRIVFASKNQGGVELQDLVLETIHELIERACKRTQMQAQEIIKAVIAGNSTMIHLLLGLPPASIRLTPFVTTANFPPQILAKEIGLRIHPEAAVDCLPGVASYVGADITAGVLSAGVDDTDRVTLFMDIGTNGEIVLGCRDWLVTCACSAGPAFEGAGVVNGMRATKGAIEEVWIDHHTWEPTYRVIGGVRPRGVCGSGLISLLAELFLTGIVDKAGNLDISLDTPRVRRGDHSEEYVIAWAQETSHGEDIVLSRVDIDNLLRAKAAVYAGFSVLAEKIEMPLEDVEQILVGGSFGQYINVEKAIEIGLLPDLPWEQFHYLGNTSIRGAYQGLIDREARARIKDIAGRMTYIELSADNSFYEAFTSALFLPHTDMDRFPSVQARIWPQVRQTTAQ